MTIVADQPRNPEGFISAAPSAPCFRVMFFAVQSGIMRHTWRYSASFDAMFFAI